MGGVLARDLVEISRDPSCLSDGGFWAISTTYEGELQACKFASISDAPFSAAASSVEISGKWESSVSE